MYADPSPTRSAKDLDADFIDYVLQDYGPTTLGVLGGLMEMQLGETDGLAQDPRTAAGAASHLLHASPRSRGGWELPSTNGLAESLARI